MSADGSLSELPEPVQFGLWSHDPATDNVMAHAGLVRLVSELPNIEETTAAVFACQHGLRTSWLRIIAARLREAGKRRDAAELCSAIDILDVASRRIREQLSSASLQPTGHQAQEISLFGASAEQAVVWPKLLRVIGATAELIEGQIGHPLAALPNVEPLDSKRTWCFGRLLQLPVTDGAPSKGVTFVLMGTCGPLSDAERVASDIDSQGVSATPVAASANAAKASGLFMQMARDALTTLASLPSFRRRIRAGRERMSND